MLVFLVSLLTAGNLLAQGNVVDGRFFSPALGVSKNYRVYLPAGYGSGEQHYPVVYLLHGWGANERTWTDTLRVHEIADSIGLQSLIVMPDGDRSLYANAVSGLDFEPCLNPTGVFPNSTEPRADFCVKNPDYEDYIVNDLIAEIDSEFRTIDNRSGRALSGESAGGTGAFSLALRHPKVFSSAASHSGILAFLYDGPYPFEPGSARFVSELVPEQQSPEVLAIYGEDIQNWRAHDPYSLLLNDPDANLSIYLDCGSEDDFQFDALSAAVDELLTLNRVEHEYHAVPGGHNDELFGARIEYSLRFHSLHLTKARPE